MPLTTTSLVVALMLSWAALQSLFTGHGADYLTLFNGSVVHIAALWPTDQMLSLDALGIESLSMERREYLCRLPMRALLSKGAETFYNWRTAGIQLLSHLKTMREQAFTVSVIVWS
jgi:hypothetical protein